MKLTVKVISLFLIVSIALFVFDPAATCTGSDPCHACKTADIASIVQKKAGPAESARGPGDGRSNGSQDYVLSCFSCAHTRLYGVALNEMMSRVFGRLWSLWVR